jgi:ATP-dependent protease ClpP protease subunit
VVRAGAASKKRHDTTQGARLRDPKLLLLQTMNKVVFIREPVSEDVANNMIALTLYLDSLDKKRIYYWLNCPGGDVSTGLLS